jgi:serine/threonine-protein kinase
MARVWVAEHIALAREVAIKVIADEALHTPLARELFEREARATARVESRHVVRVLDFDFTEDGFPFLVLERLVGETLEERITRRGALSLDDARRLLAHIGDAVSAAHACGILHRDIKAENIFLVRTKDGSIDARLLDFGVAMTKSGRPLVVGTVGTAQYMSPEQMKGGAVDERSDVFSLAICVYYALTAMLPFDGESLAEVATALTRLCSSVREARPSLPQWLDAWFVRALARNRDERFSSVTEMCDAFERALARRIDRRTPLTLEVDVAPVVAAGVPRRRSWIGWTAACVAVCVAAVGATHPARVAPLAHRVASLAMANPVDADEPAKVERVDASLVFLRRLSESRAPRETPTKHVGPVAE